MSILPKVAEGGHGENELRSVGTSWQVLTAWLCCCDWPNCGIEAQPKASPTTASCWTLRSPTGTLYPMARRLSPQHCGSELPVCALRSRASPAPGVWPAGPMNCVVNASGKLVWSSSRGGAAVSILPDVAEGGHGENELRSVGTFWQVLTAWLCCCDWPNCGIEAQPKASPTTASCWTLRSPTGTLYPMARRLSPQHCGSELPVCALRSRASPAPGGVWLACGANELRCGCN